MCDNLADLTNKYSEIMSINHDIDIVKYTHPKNLAKFVDLLFAYIYAML